LLDFNGVLLDDERLHYRAFAEAARPWDFSFSWDTYLDRYLAYDDRGAAEAIVRDARDAGGSLPGSSTLVSELLARKQQAYVRLTTQGPVFFEGAREFVEQQAQAGPIVIVSGAWHEEIDQALQQLGVRHLIVDIVSAERTRACKPNPEGYLLGLEILQRTLGQPDPRPVVAVEDSPGGVRAARAANVPVVAVTHTVAELPLRQAGAHHVASSLAELTPALLTTVATSLLA